MTDKEKIEKYLNKYSHCFTENEEKYIFDFLKYYKKNKNIFLPLEIQQIYDECEIISENNNIYNGYIKLLEKMNYKGKKILEIGEGFNPRLAIRISKKLTSGTITVYDPLIYKNIKKNKKLKIKRKLFKQKENIKDYNLIISFMAKKAAEIAIEYAINNNLDFIVALYDGGLNDDEFDFYTCTEEWIHAIILNTNNKLKKANRPPLIIEYLYKYHSSYPVLINKTYIRKKPNNIIAFPKNIRYN